MGRWWRNLFRRGLWQRMRLAASYPVYHSESIDCSYIKIFTYGSLVDEGSAANTLSEASLRTGEPAIAYGLKRVFNRDFPLKATSNWGIPHDSSARGMLNLLPTGNPTDRVNGLLFTVVAPDLQALFQREEGYLLIPIVCSPWGIDKGSYEIVYTFIAPQDHLSAKELYPRPGYYELTRDAAKKFGEDFYHFWVETTYLADGTTSITEWERAVSAGEDKTKSVTDDTSLFLF